MAELINLRRARKAAARVEKEKQAAANRLTHGTPKALRKAAKAESRRADQKIGSHKLESN